MLSSIVQQFDLPSNRLYRIRNEMVQGGIEVTDVVSGNVNAQGIVFPTGIFEKAMAAGVRASRLYRPDPLGQSAARQAIGRYYAAEGLTIPEGQILLTPGTSISYWYAFRLLADAGEEILCPSPSYPLFDSIAALSGVQLIPYPLREGVRWEIDFNALLQAVTSRTKAIVLISPHNPTGAVASEAEVSALAGICQERDLAIISDEVFSPFLFGGARKLPRPAMTPAPHVITLNGLSKMLALPGLKIGWMAVTGDPSLVRKSMKTLEMISDTFLPVNEAAQSAVPQILMRSRAFQKSYALEIEKRMAYAVDFVKGRADVSLVQPEGGFFLTLRLERSPVDEEELACRLLQKHRILVHPGYFYDMEGQHLVMSFVNRPPVLKKATQMIWRESI